MGITFISDSDAGWSFPHYSFWITEALLSVCILGGGRFAIRALYHHSAGYQSTADAMCSPPSCMAPDTRALGCAIGGTRPRAGFRPVGFLTMTRGWRGEIVAGHRVFGGLGSMKDAVAKTGPGRS